MCTFAVAKAHLAILLEVSEALVLKGGKQGMPQHNADLVGQREVDLQAAAS